MEKFESYVGPIRELPDAKQKFKALFPKPEPRPEDREKFQEFYEMLREFVEETFNNQDEDEDNILMSSVGASSADPSSAMSSVGASTNE